MRHAETKYTLALDIIDAIDADIQDGLASRNAAFLHCRYMKNTPAVMANISAIAKITQFHARLPLF